MTSYNATLQLEDRFDAALAEQLVDELADFHPAVSRSLSGHIEVVVTMPAESVRQAVITAISVVGAHHVVTAIDVVTTDEFDRRLGLEPVPDLLSVTEAAAALGVTRQAVLQRIEAGSLTARRVGTAWVIPRTAVAATDQDRHSRRWTR